MTIRTRGLRRPRNDRVIGVSLDMLLQVLGTLEALATEVAFVRFQRDMDTDVGSDVVAFDRGRMAIPPCTRQVEVIRTLAANMTLADMIL